MLVFDADVVVCEHGHVPDFSLVLLGHCGPVVFLVAVEIFKAGFDGLDGLLVQVEVGQDHTFVYVC
jgi:hypothetical protein